MTIKKAETERAIERRRKSHAYLEREEQKEPWIPMALHQHVSITKRTRSLLALNSVPSVAYGILDV